MRHLAHPAIDDVQLTSVLSALGDPVRLAAVHQLAAQSANCVDIELPVSKSTKSHHLRVMREAGLVRVTPNGRFRHHELRADELEARFPGLLPAVLAGASGA